ncbi:MULTISPECIES: MerR family transcriptional regulator [unclassified Staphylococcus]|uniref:MerR family transcriptional regulator n=1 Tax=unclassified Staphylococcus TaxID=91994 RepID=UPI0021D12238|nr:MULTISPECIES: MerR family transcriptional regulator [unclassified Staphylococcus]UXR77809.1 MerR family transcriptional regulator [Staphylococcus sp. IVB6227]UXR81968.1 MerR family transcriptional regulator [Staphylococcus sp. IVB6214]
MAMTVKEVANLVGISIRTLHHYNKIGLLIPEEITDAGYRLYSEQNLKTLQQILFFKEIGFTLKEIKNILSNPSFDRYEALILQRKMLVEKRHHIDNMIETVDKTIEHMIGGSQMTNKERFYGLNMQFNPYEEEARRRWGDEAVNETNAKLSSMSKDKQQDVSEKWDMIFMQLASLRNQSPESPKVQKVIKEWYRFLNNNFRHYSLEAFQGLSQLYIQDERFTNNIDQYGEGLAHFMSEAMTIFTQKSKAD